MIILGERGSGKTDQILRECARNRGILITPHKTGIDINRCERYGVNRSDIFSYQDLIKGNIRGLGERKVYIDEAQTFINYFVSTHGGGRLAIGGLVIAADSIHDYRLNYGLITKYKATILDRIKLAIDAFKHGV